MPLALIRPTTLYAWNGPSLLIVNSRGDCDRDEPLTGYYFRETRFIRTLRFEINGKPPWLCEAASVTPTQLAFTYVFPEIAEYDGGGSGQSGDQVPTDHDGIPQRALAIRVRYDLRLDGLAVDLSITNHSKKRVPAEIAWMIDADFADIQEAQNNKREQQADIETTSHAMGVTLTYAHARLHYRTSVQVTTHGDWTISTVFRGGRAGRNGRSAPLLNTRLPSRDKSHHSGFRVQRSRLGRRACRQP